MSMLDNLILELNGVTRQLVNGAQDLVRDVEGKISTKATNIYLDARYGKNPIKSEGYEKISKQVEMERLQNEMNILNQKFNQLLNENKVTEEVKQPEVDKIETEDICLEEEKQEVVEVENVETELPKSENECLEEGLEVTEEEKVKIDIEEIAIHNFETKIKDAIINSLNSDVEKISNLFTSSKVEPVKPELIGYTEHGEEILEGDIIEISEENNNKVIILEQTVYEVEPDTLEEENAEMVIINDGNGNEIECLIIRDEDDEDDEEINIEEELGKEEVLKGELTDEEIDYSVTINSIPSELTSADERLDYLIKNNISKEIIDRYRQEMNLEETKKVENNSKQRKERKAKNANSKKKQKSKK